jgi:hypothetical protein
MAYIGSALVPRSTLVGDLAPLVAPLVAAKMGGVALPPGTQLLFLEEIRFEPVMVELLDKAATLRVRRWRRHGMHALWLRSVAQGSHDATRAMRLCLCRLRSWSTATSSSCSAS